MAAHLSSRQARHELALLSLAGTVVFFGLWQGVALSGLVSNYVLPSPVEVLTTGLVMVVEPFAGNTLQGHAKWRADLQLAGCVRFPVGQWPDAKFDSFSRHADRAETLRLVLRRKAKIARTGLGRSIEVIERSLWRDAQNIFSNALWERLAA